MASVLDEMGLGMEYAEDEVGTYDGDFTWGGMWDSLMSDTNESSQSSSMASMDGIDAGTSFTNSYQDQAKSIGQSAQNSLQSLMDTDTASLASLTSAQPPTPVQQAPVQQPEMLRAEPQQPNVNFVAPDVPSPQLQAALAPQPQQPMSSPMTQAEIQQRVQPEVKRQVNEQVAQQNNVPTPIQQQQAVAPQTQYGMDPVQAQQMAIQDLGPRPPDYVPSTMDNFMYKPATRKSYADAAKAKQSAWDNRKLTQDINMYAKAVKSPYTKLMSSSNPKLAAVGLKQHTAWQQQYHKPAAKPTLSNSAKIAGELGFKPGTDASNNFIRSHAMKAGGTTVNMGPGKDYIKPSDLLKFKAPDGKGGFSDVPPGTTYSDLPAMGAVLRRDMTEGKAGKLNMLESSQAAFDKINTLMYKKDGAVDTDVVKAMWAIDRTSGIASPLVGMVGGEALRNKADILQDSFELGIQAITRTETGATMPPEEVDNTKRRFKPDPFATDEANMNRIMAYQEFINNAVTDLNPESGKKGFTREEWDKRIDAALKKHNVTSDKFNIKTLSKSEKTKYDNLSKPDRALYRKWIEAGRP